MEDYTFLHQISLLVHIIFGSLALLLGIIAMATKKGGKVHIRTGRLFLVAMTVVIGTALAGVFIFKANAFLLVLTLLSGYQAFSGYRILKLKSNKAKLLDIGVACIAISSAIYFLYYLESIGMIWAPVVIYSTVGALFLIIAYDFLRYFIPAERYKKIWIYEHIYKMVAAFTALLAAFVGNVFPQYHPYSQILPSVFGTFLAIGFIIYFYRMESVRKKNVPYQKTP